jgi:hypothetical protein
LNAPRKLALLSAGPATATALLPSVPEAARPAALSDLRVTLDRAAADGAQALAIAAETQRQKLAADYPEA